VARAFPVGGPEDGASVGRGGEGREGHGLEARATRSGRPRWFPDCARERVTAHTPLRHCVSNAETATGETSLSSSLSLWMPGEVGREGTQCF
jgi:hypothetical protein